MKFNVGTIIIYNFYDIEIISGCNIDLLYKFSHYVFLYILLINITIDIFKNK